RGTCHLQPVGGRHAAPDECHRPLLARPRWWPGDAKRPEAADAVQHVPQSRADPHPHLQPVTRRALGRGPSACGVVAVLRRGEEGWHRGIFRHLRRATGQREVGPAAGGGLMAGVRVPGPGWTDARTTVVGVMGYPVRHSLSPILHNAAFAALGLNWVSVAFEVAGGKAAAALDGMRALGVAGLSVTMPHKADVAAVVDECSAVATQLRAVNCVLNRDGRLYGENTDGAGFLASLARSAHFDPAGKQCLIIGAGGAAKAVTLALADAGAASVTAV